MNVCADDWTAERAIVASNGGNGSRMNGMFRFLCNYMFFMNSSVNCFTIFFERKPHCCFNDILSNQATMQWQIGRGDAPRTATPSTERNLISFFLEILAKLHVGARWRVDASSYEVSWIRSCNVRGSLQQLKER